MRTLVPALMTCALLLAACPKPDVDVPGGNVAGTSVGTDFDGNEFTIGEGELEGRGVVVVYFTST